MIPVVVEVTNTLSVDFTTGIQRVVREIVNGLEGPAGDGLDVIPVVTPSPGADFRRLTPDELSRLRSHPAGGRAGRRADDFGRLSPVVRRFGDLPMTLRTRAAVSSARNRRRSVLPGHPELELGELRPGSVFLDIEGSWYDPTPRAELLPQLVEAGVRSMPLIHDVMPVRFPRWFTPQHVDVFRSWLTAHLHNSPMFLANSECTALDLRGVASSMDIAEDLDVRVVQLGADYPVSTPVDPDLPADVGRYLLVVGTLEPRKNQRVVLDAFDRLNYRYPDLALVLVGKEGWMVDQLVRRIRTHPELDRRLLWLGGVDDSRLAALYQHAFLTIAPSIYEGLGVPVMEALSRGCPTISSTGGALPEAGAGVTELFAPSDTDQLIALIRRHLDDPEHHHECRAAARAYRGPTWEETCRSVASAVRHLAS